MLYSGGANHCRSHNHKFKMALDSQERSKTNRRLQYYMVTESLKLINIAVVLYFLAYYLLFLHVRMAGKWSGGGGGGVPVPLPWIRPCMLIHTHTIQ